MSSSRHTSKVSKPAVKDTTTTLQPEFGSDQAAHSSSATANTARLDGEKDNSPKQLLGVYIKGMAMGAADIVPGVSGGTIALIAGIYERLINAIGSVGPELWQVWRRQGGIKGLIAIWRYVDATFLLCLIAGIATSFVTLAGAIKYLLDNQPLLIWSFFFGLVVATVFILSTEVKRWSVSRLALFAAGMVAAVLISIAPIIPVTPSLPYLFFSGAVAICAMILPGVSGSFILLLLGAYDTVLEAAHSLNLSILLTVLAGMVTGLLLFSRVLKWLLSHYYQGTLALLTGFIAGSLLKIWPWKTESLGHTLPWHYPGGAQWLTTLGLMFVGAIVVLLISWWGRRNQAY
ncbi:DUF368 domain-containing protein [Psychrobacter pygoscelis]|uniref:DUF368 domain-containing protein n=1 Tax=Psychrobacter pygoscelis TaxID=2488563 RepID=UPI00103BB4E8|nr:DUF368 domain-containing protein [Psychrobacter pygoscelis]